MKNEQRAFGVLGLVIVLLIVAFLVVFQWEKIESWRSGAKDEADQTLKAVDQFKEDIQKMEEETQKRLDNNLNP